MTPLHLLEGVPASADDLRALALSNFGHFTAMQVRGGAVQGWDFHVQRLQQATQELFGCGLDVGRMRGHLREALAAQPDCSLRVTVYSRQFDYRQAGRACPPDILLSLAAPASADKPAIRVKSFDFVRPFPSFKHVATFPLFQYRRLALQAGYDDALFVDPAGHVCEGSIWNIGLWDGQAMTWPQGPALRGSCEHLLRQALSVAGIPQQARPVRLAEVGAFQAAFALNASGIQAISQVDDVGFVGAPGLLGQLRESLAAVPWLPI